MTIPDYPSQPKEPCDWCAFDMDINGHMNTANLLNGTRPNFDPHATIIF